MKEKTWLPDPSSWKGTWRDDWRIMGQEGYLYGKNLHYRCYSREICFEDFIKCEFCNSTFREDPSVKVYFEPISKFWICETCFQDFQSHFAWSVTEQNID